MTPTELREARKRLGLTQARLADELGIAQVTVVLYERGSRYDGGPAPIPRVVELAMRYLDANPPP